MRRLLRRDVLGVLAALVITTGVAAPASADPRDFLLTNDTGRTIEHVYVSPSSQPDWGDDILGEGFLEEGGSVTIKFARFTPGDCLYAIKVVTSEGDEGVYSPVDLCGTTTVTLR
jgi:hypothetical protein